MWTLFQRRESRKGVSHSSLRKKRRTILAVDRLQDRCVPTVTLGANFHGMAFTDTAGYVPPDTNAAAGTNHIVELVNTEIAVYNKNGSGVSIKDLGTFFGTADQLSDPVVMFDAAVGKFFVTVLDISADNLLYARFSDTNVGIDPTTAGGNVELGSINVTDSGGPSGTTTGDYPRLGRNVDAYFVSLNMFDAVQGSYDHVSLVTIPKANFQHATRSDPFGLNDSAGNNFSFTPAIMHDTVSGGSNGAPVYFVEEAGYGNGHTIRVVREDNPVSTPIFTSYNVGVAAYTEPPAATQEGSSTTLETNDSRILNAEWRNNMLVAAQTVGLSTDAQAHARWYAFSTSGTPTLIQQGTIGAGSGSNSYYPAIALDRNLNVGLSFIESSSHEYMSMYVTGATYSATPFAMTLQTPVLAQAGQRTYSSFDGSPARAGDFSGIGIDPVDGSFWAANEYATSNTSAAANWGTNITNFTVSANAVPAHDVAVTGITTSSSSVRQGSSITVNVTVANVGANSESFTVTLKDTPPSGGAAGTITPASINVSLAPGQSTTVTFTYSASTSTTRGTHTLAATANLATDSNSSNNSLSTTISVTRSRGGAVSPPPAQPLIYRDQIQRYTGSQTTDDDDRFFAQLNSGSAVFDTEWQDEIIRLLEWDAQEHHAR